MKGCLREALNLSFIFDNHRKLSIFCSIIIHKRTRMSEKIYPIGIQNFEKIRKEGYFYIDKTA